MARVNYFSEPVPSREAHLVACGVRRLVANNPSPRRLHGTNTYLVEGEDGYTVIDPGPYDTAEAHSEAILAACGGNVARIFLTHTHKDHCGGTSILKQMSGAAVCSFVPSFDPEISIDIPLKDGMSLAGFEVVFTPGHCSDHVSFAYGDGILFCGDVIMAWAGTFVGLPEGSMRDQIRSLELLLKRNDKLLLPGHGPSISSPRHHLESSLQARLEREVKILQELTVPKTLDGICDTFYAGRTLSARQDGMRLMEAHLTKLIEEQRVVKDGNFWVLSSSGDLGS